MFDSSDYCDYATSIPRFLLSTKPGMYTSTSSTVETNFDSLICKYPPAFEEDIKTQSSSIRDNRLLMLRDAMAIDYFIDLIILPTNL